MKRFFFVFTIIMVIFLVLAAGAVAAVQFGGIVASNTQPVFFANWGITQIPFAGSTITGGTIIYPDGDLFLIRQATAADVKPGDVVVYVDTDKWITRSGYIVAKTVNGFAMNASDGTSASEPGSSIVGRYHSRIPRLGHILDELKSPLAIIVFAGVLLLSIILWKALPGSRPTSEYLSESDKDIASIFY